MINTIMVKKDVYFSKVPVPEDVLFSFETYYCFNLYVTTLPDSSVIENFLNIKFTSTEPA